VSEMRVLIVDDKDDMRALVRATIEIANEGLKVAREAAGPGHALVEHDHLGTLGADHLNCGVAVGGLCRHLESFVGDFDRRPYQCAHVLFVVDDENSHLGHEVLLPAGRLSALLAETPGQSSACPVRVARSILCQRQRNN